MTRKVIDLTTSASSDSFSELFKNNLLDRSKLTEPGGTISINSSSRDQNLLMKTSVGLPWVRSAPRAGSSSCDSGR